MSCVQRISAPLHRSQAPFVCDHIPVRLAVGHAIRLLFLCLIGALTVHSTGKVRAEQQVAGREAVSDCLNLSDRVKPRGAYPGMLRASDVCMRSLRPRPINASDPHDTLQAICDFHVTRLEWTYGLTAEFIAKVEALGCTASGACANANLIGIPAPG